MHFITIPANLALKRRKGHAEELFADAFSTGVILLTKGIYVDTSCQAVVALLRETGAKLSCLHESQLVELWREYSETIHQCEWIAARREELPQFIYWVEGRPEPGGELLLAATAGAPVAVDSADALKYTVRVGAANESGGKRNASQHLRPRVTVRFKGGRPRAGDQKGP